MLRGSDRTHPAVGAQRSRGGVMMRAVRWTMFVSLALSGAMALAGCSGSPSAPPSSSTPSTSTSSSMPTSTTPSPTTPAPTETSTTPSPTPTSSSPSTSTPPPAPTVQLTGDGVGNLAWDAAGATAAVEALLGPPDSIEDFPSECGVQGVKQLGYGGATINIQSDALFSWTVTLSDPVPTAVGLPHGVTMGSSWAGVTALPGAKPAQFLDNYQVYQVEVQEPGTAASVFYWADANQPTSHVVMAAGRYILGCG